MLIYHVQTTELTSESSSLNPLIRHTYEELKSWDWLYGQTPEFSHTLSGSFDWGQVNLKLQSKHGKIISAVLTSTDVRLNQSFEELGAALEGMYISREYLMATDPSHNRNAL